MPKFLSLMQAQALEAQELAALSFCSTLAPNMQTQQSCAGNRCHLTPSLPTAQGLSFTLSSPKQSHVTFFLGPHNPRTTAWTSW